jgi:hypothetical protein
MFGKEHEMKPRTQAFIATAAVLLFLGSVALADVSRTTGTISNVTVYRGQALVTRAIEVDLQPGTSELIVDDLPRLRKPPCPDFGQR